MNITQQNNRNHITKQQFMNTMIQYLWNMPFDVEKFALIVEEYIQDDEIQTYLEAIMYDYEHGDPVDEIEARGVVYDKANPFFTQIFADYYNQEYLEEIIHQTQADLAVATLVKEVLETPTREKQSHLYTENIQQAFARFPSSQARKSMVAWAQKILTQALIEESDKIWQDDYIGV
jgi:hypothetical protein